MQEWRASVLQLARRCQSVHLAPCMNTEGRQSWRKSGSHCRDLLSSQPSLSKMPSRTVSHAHGINVTILLIFLTLIICILFCIGHGQLEIGSTPGSTLICIHYTALCSTKMLESLPRRPPACDSGTNFFLSFTCLTLAARTPIKLTAPARGRTGRSGSLCCAACMHASTQQDAPQVQPHLQFICLMKCAFIGTALCC